MRADSLRQAQAAHSRSRLRRSLTRIAPGFLLLYTSIILDILGARKVIGYDALLLISESSTVMVLDWADRTKRFLKAELKRGDVTYEQLAKRLSEMGLD